jgi:hypothetical protein
MASKATWWRTVAGIVLFSATFGYVEAAVVAYLRAIYSPLHLRFYPGASPSDLFPLLSLDQLRDLGEEHLTRLKTELCRELATLLMLGGVALMNGRNVREWLAVFLACFGIWDLTFYISLKALLNWPASLLTWDLLFLLPVPWVGPVAAPLLVAISMIGIGLAVLWREYNGDPVEIGRIRWILIIAGGALLFVAFTADFGNTTRGRYPMAFHWGLFLAGETGWLLALASALKRRGKDRRNE